jgi:hypothetical protein
MARLASPHFGGAGVLAFGERGYLLSVGAQPTALAGDHQEGFPSRPPAARSPCRALPRVRAGRCDSAGVGRQLAVWHWETGDLLASTSGHGAPVRDACWVRGMMLSASDRRVQVCPPPILSGHAASPTPY